MLALVLSLLSICAWGMQYKVSLYRVQDDAHSSMPAAKLLSPRERATPASQAKAPHVPPQNFFTASLPESSLFAEPELLSVARETVGAFLKAQDATAFERFARPPPARG